MAGLSAPRSLYGIHAFTPYSRTDGTPYGTVKVLKSSSLNLTGSLVDLMGGSAKYPWNVETGPITAELQLKGNDYKSFLFTLFLGVTPTDGSTEATGNVTTLTNKLNASVKNAVTGVASVAVHTGNDQDLKFGKYVLKATDATHVDVYLLGDIDIARGADGAIQNDALKITASPLVVTTGAVLTNIPSFGLDLVGGSGTIAMVAGDTATFTVRPDNTANTVVTVGSSAGTVFPEFGAIVHAQKRGDQELSELDIFRCIGNGMPINFDMNAWSEYDIKVKCMYDSVLDGVYMARFVSPSNT